MLVFSAIVPHSKSLIADPKEAPETIKALGDLKKSLHEKKLDGLVVLSPRGTILQKGFAINLAQKFETNPDALGIKVEKREYKSYPQLSMDIKNRRLSNTESPVMLVSNKDLDYGTAVPLQFLLDKGSDIAIAPIFPSVQGLAEHVAFGGDIREALMSSDKRYGVLASAELAFGADGDTMDKKLIAALQNDASMKYLQSTPVSDIQKFQLFGLAPLVMLAGIMRGLPWTYSQLAHERVENQGLLVAELTLRS